MSENEILNSQLPQDAPMPAAPRPVETHPALDPEPWYARIESAALAELPRLEAELRLLPTDEATLRPLQEALANRRMSLWAGELEAMIAHREDLDCAGLQDLAQRVRETDYPAELRNQSLETLRRAYVTREQAELSRLSGEAEPLDIPALEDRIRRIQEGPYTAEAAAPYVSGLNRRIDALHIRALETLCAGLETADQTALDAIRAEVARRSCAPALKADFERRILERQDALDLQDLEALTANLDSRTPRELLELAQTLETGSYNSKLVNRFRLRVSLAREAAFCRQIDTELTELDRMDRRQVLERKDSLNQRALPRRLTYRAEQDLDERLYRVDLLDLLDRESNFDALGFEDLDLIRAAMARMELCDRARTDYLSRLDQRERALVLENTSSRAGLVEQSAAMHKVKRKDIDLATTCEDYETRLQRFWGGTGLEQPRDIPVFLLNNASVLGFSGTRFWYKSGKDLAFLPLAELERIQCMKHMFTVDLQIVRKDSTYLLTEAKLNRAGAEKLLDFLNECLRRWLEPNLAESYPPRLMHTAGFDRRPLEEPIPAKALDEMAALEILRQDYASRGRKDGNLLAGPDDGWSARIRKLAQGFELQAVPDVVWYYSPGILGSMKEGVAAGPDGIVFRDGKEPALCVPTEEIFTLEKVSGKKLRLTTTDGRSYILECPGEMAPLLEDYYRCVQLADYLNRANG